MRVIGQSVVLFGNKVVMFATYNFMDTYLFSNCAAVWVHHDGVVASYLVVSGQNFRYDE